MLPAAVAHTGVWLRRATRGPISSVACLTPFERLHDRTNSPWGSAPTLPGALCAPAKAAACFQLRRRAHRVATPPRHQQSRCFPLSPLLPEKPPRYRGESASEVATSSILERTGHAAGAPALVVHPHDDNRCRHHRRVLVQSHPLIHSSQHTIPWPGPEHAEEVRGDLGKRHAACRICRACTPLELRAQARKECTVGVQEAAPQLWSQERSEHEVLGS